MVNYYIRTQKNGKEVLEGTENGKIIDLSAYGDDEELKQQKEDLMNLRGDY